MSITLKQLKQLRTNPQSSLPQKNITIPRNSLARQTKTQNKNRVKKIFDNKIKLLETICDKHKIGDLTFKSCKFIRQNGKMTVIDYDVIRGNLKLGIMIIKANRVTDSGEIIYDLIQIGNEKKERDEKIRKEKEEKENIEKQRLFKEVEQVKPLDNESEKKHEELLNQLNTNEEIKEILTMEPIVTPT